MTAEAAPLLDTTYLLPLFGIEIEVHAAKKHLSKLLSLDNNILYHPLSLVEAKWVILALERRQPNSLRARFTEGLEILLEDGRFEQSPITSPSVEHNADRLLEEGLSDYFDRMLVSTAHNLNATLITEDEELLNSKGPTRILSGFRTTTLSVFVEELVKAD